MSGSVVQQFSTLNLKDHAYSQVEIDMDENGFDSIPGGNSKFKYDLSKGRTTSSFLTNGNGQLLYFAVKNEWIHFSFRKCAERRIKRT
jgi:hypothetical protein